MAEVAEPAPDSAERERFGTNTARGVAWIRGARPSKEPGHAFGAPERVHSFDAPISPGRSSKMPTPGSSSRETREALEAAAAAGATLEANQRSKMAGKAALVAQLERLLAKQS